MVIRRRKSFHRLFALLRRIEADPSDLDAVRLLNVGVVKEIFHAERSIAKHKAEQKKQTAALKLGRGSREQSLAIRKYIKRIDGYVSARQDQIYIWKSFGDALAYSYLDKFSIKHAFFENDKFGIKRGAGALTGKDGLVAEISCLLDALEHGVPAVLCDITNTLRYGDVCLLGGSDPYLIEVKTSERGNKRRQRQMGQLQSLHSFLEKDEAEGFRGNAGVTHRLSLESEERNHLVALEKCISEARLNGQSWVQPEVGVTYIAVYGKFDPASMPTTIGGTALFYSLNADKNSHTWAPYVPFLLTIRNEEHLIDFIQGKLSLFVIVEIDELCRLIAVDGWLARSRPGADYLIETLHPASGEFQSMSSQLISRVAYEFVALNWLADIHGMRPPSFGDSPPAQASPDSMKAVMREMFIERFGADDEWVPLLS